MKAFGRLFQPAAANINVPLSLFSRTGRFITSLTKTSIHNFSQESGFVGIATVGRLLRKTGFVRLHRR